MFSRRHPYLFFMLVFSALVCISISAMSSFILIGLKSAEFEFGEKVGVIEIQGAIIDSLPIIRDIKAFREDKQIKAIVLRIDSPGGGAAPSQEIFNEIRKTIKVKNVIASMGYVAASGGYYIAAGANGIVASPGTITGSIGVRMGITNIEEIFKKIGLKSVIVKSGEFKDIASPVREMTLKEKKILQSVVDDIHNQFTEDISTGRNIPLEDIRQIADGRILTGNQAKEWGLIDRFGNIEDAIEWAAELGNIKGKISVVYAKQKKFSLFEYITGSSIENLINKFLSTQFSSNLYIKE
ncbi:protease IV [Candidatus Magnetomoraceae bacterium gMMP-13]